MTYIEKISTWSLCLYIPICVIGLDFIVMMYTCSSLNESIIRKVAWFLTFFPLKERGFSRVNQGVYCALDVMCLLSA